MIGQTLNHYTIVEKLGEGGMAEVYLAVDTRLGRKVALKLLPPEVAADAVRRERFEREAKVVAALNHPNIVHIYSVEEAEGIRFITMELVDGQSLEELIPRDGMPVEDFFDPMLQLVGALAAAHRKGVTHRDIKPANVMLNSERVVKLLDLGLAKMDPEIAEGEADGLDSLTREGRAIGTVPYMAPEQLAGLPIDHRVDIFALGVLFYETLTGRRPFIGGSSAEVISAILRDKPKPLCRVKTGLPKQLGALVDRCLDKDPKRRFQTAEELEVALTTVAKSEPGFTRDIGRETVRLKRKKKSGPTRRWLVTAAIAAVAGLAAFGLIRSPAFRGSDAAASPPTAPSTLTLSLPPIALSGSEKAVVAGVGFESDLRGVLDTLDGLAVVVEGEENGNQAARPADYVLLTDIRWPADSAPEAFAHFELTRQQDQEVIWTEVYPVADLADEASRARLEALVRANVGLLLGLDVPTPRMPPAPAEAPVLEAEASPGDTPERVPSPASGANSAKPSRSAESRGRAAPDASEAQVSVSLTSTVASGVVTVYADTSRVYYKEFEFGERKGGLLGRVGLKKKSGGEFEDGILAPTATEELKVYVALGQQPARLFALEPDFRGDGTDRLVITITKRQAIDVILQ